MKSFNSRSFELNLCYISPAGRPVITVVHIVRDGEASRVPDGYMITQISHRVMKLPIFRSRSSIHASLVIDRFGHRILQRPVMGCS